MGMQQCCVLAGINVIFITNKAMQLAICIFNLAKLSIYFLDFDDTKPNFDGVILVLYTYNIMSL